VTNSAGGVQSVGVLGFTSSMTPEERVRRLVSRGAALASTRRVRIASQLLLLAGLAFVLVRLRAAWHDGGLDLSHVDWLLVVVAVLTSTMGVVATAYVWRAILLKLGAETTRSIVGVYLQAQLGKYVPGTVWQYVGRTALGRTHGVRLRALALSLPVELAASALTGAALALLLLGVAGAAAAFVVIAALSACAHPAIERRLAGVSRRLFSGRDVAGVIAAAARAVPPYAAILVVLGCGFWVTARALFAVPAADLETYVGTFVAAWLIGMLAFFAPGGIGVREAVIVALLRGKIGTDDALVLAAGSRAVSTFADVLAAAIGVVLLRTGARRPESQQSA
jgi:glycosyltransferase 2 family protein